MARESVFKTADDLKAMSNADLTLHSSKMKKADQTLSAELTALKYRLRDIHEQRDLIIEEMKRRDIWM